MNPTLWTTHLGWISSLKNQKWEIMPQTYPIISWPFLLSTTRNKKDGEARRQAAITIMKGLVLRPALKHLLGRPRCRRDCGFTQLTLAAPSAQVVAATKFPLNSPSDSLGLLEANRPQQVNPMSLAPLVPMCFVSVQITCLDPKEGALHLMLHLSFSQEAPLELFRRTL